MGNKLKFRVFDKVGNDVTDKNGWYIDNEGYLYFITDDIDMPLFPVDDYGYTYEIELINS